MYLGLIIVACFAAGYVVGRLGEGININITHKQEQTPKEAPKYNESLVDLLPNNVKQYYHENNGQNKF